MEIAYHPRTPQPPSPSAWDNFVIPEPSYVADGAGMGKRASGVTSPWVGVGQARSSNVGAVDGGIRHKQLGAAAAQRARDRADHKAIPGSHDPTAVAKSAASPYQKDIASRAAERAVRPWAPYGAGLGERRGALLAHLGPAAVQTLAGEKEDQSALYEIAPAAAKAIGEAAGRIARPGTAQMSGPDAWSAVPHGAERQLWPIDLTMPPRFCAGCRGGHDPTNEMNPAWEPYSPETRLENLWVIKSKFHVALLKNNLCVQLNSGSRVQPIRWLWKDSEGNSITPEIMSKEQFCDQFTLMFDGLREGHEPYRHLATQACLAFLATGSPHLVTAAQVAVKPMRLALQTYEPHLVGHMLTMIQRLLRSHPGVGPVLCKHFPRLLPYMALFRPRSFVLQLPPPFCLPPCGSFTGKGDAPESGRRSCKVCGVPVDKAYDGKTYAFAALEARAENAHLLDTEPPKAVEGIRLIKGRPSKKFPLSQVIDGTLDLMVTLGGPGALAVVQRYIPRYSYFNPKD